MDTYGITAIDITGDIVTAIDIIDVTTCNIDTSSIISWEGHIHTVNFDCFRSNTIIIRIDICLTASAIDVVNLHIIAGNSQQKTIIMGHVTCITTAI